MDLLIYIIVGVFPFFVLMALIAWDAKRRSKFSKLPFTDHILRPAGESLRLEVERLDEKIYDYLPTLAGSCVFIGMAASVWIKGWAVSSAAILIGLAIFVFSARRFWLVLKKRRNCYLGFLGERAVGEELNQLLIHGWRVYHDVLLEMKPGAKPFNIDHVVVGTGGVYAIETKTRRKPAGERGVKVVYDGRFLQFPWGPDDRSIGQATDRAIQLMRWLEKRFGTAVPVTPVIVLPGWSVERKAGNDIVVSGREVCQVFDGEHRKQMIDLKTTQAIVGLLEENCRTVGKY